MTVEQHLEQMIGNMGLRICAKDAQIDALTQENTALKAKIAELEKPPKKKQN